MVGPPLEIHLMDDAVPRKVSTPASIPLHWQNQVKADLDDDVRMGVLEQVSEPSDWCQRMVCVRKHDGTPRRTVDLQPLNKFCRREEWVTNTPAKQARSVPRHAWKTVTDAWNGYHSVPLRDSDRHLTTFITPWGRYRYRRNPQGFVGAGDGYNRRFDAVLTDFNDKERCVDDTIFWDQQLEQHWWRTVDFLTTLGHAGIVLNPDKFQFCSRDVDFAGFRLTADKVAPLPKYISAIRDFPTPSNITDVRSWFGLVNQVSSYGQLRSLMAPFRPFLSPKTPFRWDSQLDEAFRGCKREIIKAIEHGVDIFDPNLPTCIRTDWSKEGMGYYLIQKTCRCPLIDPACCPDGWRMTLAGSRFNSSAESRYAPVEGEALAVAWALEQSKFFTQGCDSLTVATDHKPLVKLFGDRTLDEIANPRLFRLKQRVGLWKFEIMHVPGRTNFFADAASRKPTQSPDPLESTERRIASIAVASIAIGLPDIAEAAKGDPAYLAMLDFLSMPLATEPRPCGPYHAFREKMYVSDGRILYDDRMVIPLPLRPRVLKTLHAAHQGVSSMTHRAAQTVFWPGITADIARTRDSCSTCNIIAPSLPQVPVEQSPPPSTPFEAIAADFFDLAGVHYLVTVDRLSGWIDVTRAASGSSASGAKGLIACLRALFADKGVPVELSSDGGTEFTSSATAEFLRTWGVSHRLSSAHYPQSNGRAEAAVKSAKRMLRDNTSPSGSLDMDGYLLALMTHRNTPDPVSHLSPAQVLYGRPLRDAFQFSSALDKYSDPSVRSTWRSAWTQKEEANRQRFFCQRQSTNTSSRPQLPLPIGQRVFVQSKHPANPHRWDRSGLVVEQRPHASYTVKLDGSGRLAIRTRQHLRPITLPFLSGRPPSRVDQLPYNGETRTTNPSTEPDAANSSTPPEIARDDPSRDQRRRQHPESPEPLACPSPPGSPPSQPCPVQLPPPLLPDVPPALHRSQRAPLPFAQPQQAPETPRRPQRTDEEPESPSRGRQRLRGEAPLAADVIADQPRRSARPSRPPRRFSPAP